MATERRDESKFLIEDSGEFHGMFAIHRFMLCEGGYCGTQNEV